MPIYEYSCESCGKHYEQLRRMSEADSGLECPECRSESVKRELSSFAAHSGGSARSAMPAGGGCGMGACGGGQCAFGNN
jgi:putative FmdB family regulatory protein